MYGIRFLVNGDDQAVLIDSSQNVNINKHLSVGGNLTVIGNNSINGRLDIKGDGAARTGTHGSGPLYISSNNGWNSGGPQFRHSNGTQGIGFGYNCIYATGSGDPQHLYLQPNGSSGYVGIVGGGVSDQPTNNALLHVHGTARIASTLSVAGSKNTIGSSHLGEWASLGVNYAGFGHASITQSTGNYAVLQQNDGTTMLNSALNCTTYFRINNNNVASLSASSLSIGVATRIQQTLSVGGSTKLTGTLALGSSLSVAGGAYINGVVSHSPSTTGIHLGVVSGQTHRLLAEFCGTTASDSDVMIDFTEPSNDSHGRIYYNLGSNYMAFETNNNGGGGERMRINSSGDVILQQKLSIASTVQIGKSGVSVSSIRMDTTDHFYQIHNTSGSLTFTSVQGGGYQGTLMYFRHQDGHCYVNNSLSVGGALTKGSGSFCIDHPDPQKNEKYNLWHSFVESPNEGDNIYRYRVNTINKNSIIDLPNYFKYLNKNVMTWVSAVDSFGRGYAKINDEQTQVKVIVDQDGEYNILIIGTRKDQIGVNNWKGTERLKEQND